MEDTSTPRPKLLYVDDEADNLELFTLQFSKDFDITTCSGGDEALRILGEDSGIDILLTDERMPGMSGVELLEKVVKGYPHLIRIIVSAFSDSERLLNAINRGGAHEYIVKPWRRAEVKECISRWHGIGERRRELHARAELANVMIEDAKAEQRQESKVVGENGGLKQLLELARKVAATDTSVLVRGETGTGKEVVARYVHEMSSRSSGPFVKVNCAALSETLLESELFGHEKGAFTGATTRRTGRFELANKGTLFLDEIGDISPKLQVMLLRVLQEQEFERVGGTQTIHVDVRIVAATNRHLEQAVEDGAFREDLFYRLNVFPLNIPPLRDRKEDVQDLLRFFVNKYKHLTNSAPEFDQGLVEALQDCDWPGNVREFENIVQRALVICDGNVLRTEHFYFDFNPLKAKTTAAKVDTKDADVLRAALDEFDGNCSKAARKLGIARTTFLSRAKKAGVL